MLTCEVLPKPPWARGVINWTINEKGVNNDQRIQITDTYDPTGVLHYSDLTLTNSSWKDDGEIDI